jgi:hypothetical protein
MYRLLSISLLAIAVLVGYLIREPSVSAQTLALPYSAGDSVRLEYADGMTRGLCVIEQFYGSFVSCKISSPAFVAPDAPPRIVYNLSTVISIQLVKKAE